MADPSVTASEEEEALLDLDSPNEKHASQRHSIRANCSTAALTLLCLLAVVQTSLLFYMQHKLATRTPAYSRLGRHVPQDQARLIGLPNGFWNGSSLDPQDSAWDRIDGGGHGVIAVSPEFVAQHDLPDSMAHPSDPSKRVYALQAYHMMHCLERLRDGYLELRRGEEPMKPLEHDLHCFDALRQSIMCHASDELLVITGHGHARGYNQTVQCRSWDDLRDFATEHTACYHDEPANWQFCDDGSDGLPIGSLLG